MNGVSLLSSPVMDIAALVIAVIALLISARSAIYARNQAVAARDTLQLENGRRFEERRPKFHGVVETMNPTSAVHWYRLQLRLVSAEPLKEIQVAIVEGNGFSFTPGQFGVESFASPDYKLNAKSINPLQPGAAEHWRVELDKDCSDIIRLKIECRGESGDQWTVSVMINVMTYAVPAGELLPLLNELHLDFNSLIGAGGKSPEWFHEEQRERYQQSLASYHGGIVDDRLNSLVARARNAFFDCDSLASRPEQQLRIAEEGRSSLSSAITRLNELVRKGSSRPSLGD